MLKRSCDNPIAVLLIALLLASSLVVDGFTTTSLGRISGSSLQTIPQNQPPALSQYTSLAQASTSSNSAMDSALFSTTQSTKKPISKFVSTLAKMGMIAFIAGMCLTLPIALFPPYLLYKLKLVSRVQKEQMALRCGQFCARWVLRVFPFTKVNTIPYHDQNPEPSIWVCNHESALDIFILLATDKRLRGEKGRRPIKIVYVSTKHRKVKEKFPHYRCRLC